MKTYVYEIEAHGSATKEAFDEASPSFGFVRGDFFYEADSGDLMDRSDSFLFMEAKQGADENLEAIEVRTAHKIHDLENFKNALQADLDNVFTMELGDAKLKDIEGEIPETLYMLATEDELEQALKTDLCPDPIVMLYEAEQLPVQIADSKVEAPVILSVDASDAKLWAGPCTRYYNGLHMSVHTSDVITADKIQEADLSKGGELYQTIYEASDDAAVRMRLGAMADDYKMRQDDKAFGAEIGSLEDNSAPKL